MAAPPSGHSSFSPPYQHQQQPNQSVSRVLHRPSLYSEMATGDMLQEMVFYNERSTTSPLLYPVNFSHQPQCASLTPSASQTLKRSHWKNLGKADRCSDSKCGNRFTLLVKKRNCCMCGEVFCHKCTGFRRKLSPDATPDPSFGTLCHVCHACFDATIDETGNALSWTDLFEGLRRRAKLSVRQKEEDSMTVPIPSLKTQASAKLKRERVLQEIDRLVIGFTGSNGWVKSLISIPSWHKSHNWAEPRVSHQCFQCHTTFKVMLKKVISKKVNCRVCGQVYCSACTKEEIILFLPDSKSQTAKWAINGKVGTPTSPPHSCALLPVCVTCVKELEEILIDEIEAYEDEMDVEEEEDFMDTLSALQGVMYGMKTRIETWLPQYQKLVDSMEINSQTSHSTHTKELIEDLARNQSNLSDRFSHLAIESQKLRKLEPCTPTQQKVLKNLTIATYRFYSDNMYLFRTARHRLSEIMPVESIELIQRAINQISIERVHILVRQITFEVIHLELRFKLVGSSMTQQLVECVGVLEEECEVYFEKIGENWGKHAKAVSCMIQEDFEGTNPQRQKVRRIKVSGRVKKTHFRNTIILYKILTQCSFYLSESLRELSAKTSESSFIKTKEAIETVNNSFNKEVLMLQRHHPQIFTKEVCK